MSNDTQNNDWIGTLLRSNLGKLPPIYATIVTIALVVFVQYPNSSICEVKANEPIQSQQYNSRVDYERLKIEMSQVEVESILGRGIEIERSHDSSTLI